MYPGPSVRKEVFNKRYGNRTLTLMSIRFSLSFPPRTRTRIQSFNCVHCPRLVEKKPASVFYVPVLNGANYGQQYFIPVVSNIIGYCTKFYHLITKNSNENSEKTSVLQICKSANRWQVLCYFSSKQSR